MKKVLSPRQRVVKKVLITLLSLSTSLISYDIAREHYSGTDNHSPANEAVPTQTKSASAD
jgi:hypothetical protein